MGVVFLHNCMRCLVSLVFVLCFGFLVGFFVFCKWGIKWVFSKLCVGCENLHMHVSEVIAGDCVFGFGLKWLGVFFLAF